MEKVEGNVEGNVEENEVQISDHTMAWGGGPLSHAPPNIYDILNRPF